MQKQGRLKSWNDEKGFGFIANDNGGQDYFIHISAFHQQYQRPKINQQILFTPSKDKQGRYRAIDAHLVGHGVNKKRKTVKERSWGILPVGFSMAFIILVAVLVAVEKLSGIVLYWYLMLSVILFALYKSDKRAAKMKYWRTKENTLHTLSFFGGWPGALIAQQTLRHKSSKTSFRYIYLFTLSANLAGFVWLFTEQGESILGFIDHGVKNGLMTLLGFLKTI